MFNLTLKQAQGLKKKGNLVPLFKKLRADTETPISVYLKVAGNQAYSFLLESAENGRKLGRYSFIGLDPLKIIRLRNLVAEIETDGQKRVMKFENPMMVLKEEIEKVKFVKEAELPYFQGGLVGYLSYDVVKYFEKIKLPAAGSEVPEGIMVLPRVLVIFDHLKQEITLVTLMELSGNVEKNYYEAQKRLGELEEKISRPLAEGSLARRNEGGQARGGAEISQKPNLKFQGQVRKAKEKIKEGEIFQVVLSQKFGVKTAKSDLEIYRSSRLNNPSAYMFFLKYPDFSVIGSSPETMVHVRDRKITLKPIAGTRRRGKTAKEDRMLAQELKNDEKERAEHMMLLDLGRNDVGRVSKIGTVKVKKSMQVQKYAQVMHLVSTVEGELADGQDEFEVFQACFPAGTLSGAPKIRAMEIISAMEPVARGIYGGAVGYFDFAGNMDFAIAIRTIVKKGSDAYIQAGAGIVYDSDPKREDQECFNKAKGALLTL